MIRGYRLTPLLRSASQHGNLVNNYCGGGREHCTAFHYFLTLILFIIICLLGAMARRASDGGANILQFVQQWYHAGDLAPSPLTNLAESHQHAFSQQQVGSAASFSHTTMFRQMPSPAGPPPNFAHLPGMSGSMSGSVQSASGLSPDEDDEEDQEAIRRYIILCDLLPVITLYHQT